ncbi:hypothetical protein [Paraburkholderia dinghuensis]|uniref:Uncharacterized protein n=1 Tax=Paraburkholderia dinghuensis TaxID=2305225 RepID=A0A3N6MYR3_9BURK|nr:hypothetical protein [Paraburkholderia dinghuensis]RQH01632.1 hypothetical protein D1Y85_22965 [Paraburkholderia dinghuensis]
MAQISRQIPGGRQPRQEALVEKASDVGTSGVSALGVSGGFLRHSGLQFQRDARDITGACKIDV